MKLISILTLAILLSFNSCYSKELACKKNSECVLCSDVCGSLKAIYTKNINGLKKIQHKYQDKYDVFKCNADQNSGDLCEYINVTAIEWPKNAKAICIKHICEVDKYFKK